MNKGKEWLEKQINKTLNIDGGSGERIEGFNKGLEFSLDLINQLDEPESPVIPQFVADWIDKNKNKYNIKTALGNIDEQEDEICDWVLYNLNAFVRAWIDGYTIEVEKLYRVLMPNRTYLVQSDIENYEHWFNERVEMYDNVTYEFTEQEIKAIDERYWSFSEEVQNEQ